MKTDLQTEFRLHTTILRLFLITVVFCFTLIFVDVYAQESERDPVVWRVSFEGNEAFRDRELRNVIASLPPPVTKKMIGRTADYFFSTDEVRRDAIRIERFYQRRGFHLVEVSFDVEEMSKPWRKQVTFRISEGDPLRIAKSTIVIDADEDVEDELINYRDFRRLSANHSFRESRRYQTVRIQETENKFSRIVEDRGFAWVETSVHAEIDSASNRVDVELLIEPKQRTYFGDFVIEGDLSVSESRFIRKSGLRSGDIYSRSKLQDAQRLLFNHHLFRFATISIPEQVQDSSVTTLIRVREHPLRTMQATIGIDREEYLRGQIAWQNRNINGRGHRLGANVRASFIEQFASTDYLFPYVFNSKSSVVTTLFGRRKIEPAFKLQQAGINSSLIYNFRRNVAATVAYEYSINAETDRSLFFRTPYLYDEYKISSFRFSGLYTEGFSLIPRGWVVQMFAEVSGTLREADYRFQKFSLDVRRFTPVWRGGTIAKRVYSGAIFSSEESVYPNNIVFYTGGTNSVRGWYRQALGPKIPSFNGMGDFQGYVPIGGRAVFNFNAELRQNFGRAIPNFGVAAFLDGGQVWRDVNSLGERPVQFGAGGGLHYMSPIGPIRIDVAYKLNPTDEDLNIFEGVDYGSAWNRIGIHFSIGYAF